MKQLGVEGTAATLNTKEKGAVLPDTVSFYMPNTLQFGNVKAIRVQDVMVFDIVASSNWQRPIYFAMTVPADGQIGLKDYLQLDGLAFRLTPKKGASFWSNLNEPRMRAHLFTDVEKPSQTPALGYRWRGLNDSTTYFDEDVRRLMINYRQAFVLLSQYYTNTPNQGDKIAEPLERMERLIPRHTIEMDYRTKMYVANLYNVAGKTDKFHELCNEIIAELKPMVERGAAEPLSFDNPYVVLLQAYENLGMFDDALKLVEVIRLTYGREPGIDQIAMQLRSRIQAEKMGAQKKDSIEAASSTKQRAQTMAPKGK